MKGEKGVKREEQPDLCAAGDKRELSVKANTYAGAALVEYSVSGEPWRCNHMDLLSAEFEGLQVAELPLFHAITAVPGKERGWLIVRRLFGLRPVIPPAQFNPEDFQEWSPQDLQAALGITRNQFQSELDAVRGAWRSAVGPKQDTKVEPQAPSPPREEFHFAQEELLEKHGLTLQFKNRAEGEWFAKRVKDYDKLLGERMTAVLARNALMTEWQLKQLDEFLSNSEGNRQGSEEWRKNMKVRQELSSTYEKQLTQINALAPWASSITGKFAFTGVLSDITRGIQEYHAKGETRLIDGLFTAMEIRVELRRSVQAPEPRYRASLAVYVNAAKQGLWDPNWQSPFSNAEFKKIDAAWRAAIAAASNEAGEKLPDLEKSGPEGEYAPLVTKPTNT